MIYLSLPIDIDRINNPEELYNIVISKMPQGSDAKLISNTTFYYFNKYVSKENANEFLEYFYNLNIPVFGDLSKFYPLQDLQPHGGEKGNGAINRGTVHRETSGPQVQGDN